jgi:toxin ParE1/3/4
MAKAILRQKAIDDLRHIWFTTFINWSEKQANKYYEILEFSCKQIGEKPEIGKEYKEIETNLLGLKSGKHIIFYQIISNEEIEIIRILHERMDLKNRLSE